MTSDSQAEYRVLDLFAGVGGWSQAFRGRPNWEVTRVDYSETFDRKLSLDPWDEATMVVETDVRQDVTGDVRELSWRELGTDWDLILAGPDCRGFTLMNAGKNWDDGQPGSEAARDSLVLLFRTFEMIETISPTHYVVENPKGMAGDYLRSFAKTVHLIHQCQYGKPFMKPTYLAHNLPDFTPRRCERGAGCHQTANRGDDAGTQACKVPPPDRACIPRALSEAVRNAVEESLEGEATEQATLEVVA